MIASSAFAKGAALLGAVALHGALLFGLALNDETARTDGAAAALETRLGNSFADMAQTAALPDAVTESAVKATPQTATLKPVAPSTRAAQPAAVVAATAPVATATPVAENAPTTALRPVTRPKALEAKPAKAKPKPKPAAAKPKAKGASDGKAKAKPKPKSTGTAQTSAQGNAAAKNYPGQVMRKISRVPKPRVGAAGVATVRFTIAANGGLASVAIAQSSGVASLDRAALKVIQRAAPFPKPPSGAQRSFSLKIKGR